MEADRAMSTRARRGAFAVGAALVAGVALWPVARESPPQAAVEPEPPARPVAPRAAARRPAAHALQPTAAAAPLVAASGDGHPHPITPEHESLQQELRLVGALQDALDLEDVPALRALVERYRAHVPADENKLGEGYARLADCLDTDAHDPSTARAAAAAYYQNERASTLRRYIRRYCLER
jgi:hypothetical protein